jgi:hypothetical protein
LLRIGDACHALETRADSAVDGREEQANSAERELGIDFADEAFDGLIRHRVITAVFPEAKPGDSGRQFWDFANWVAL